MKYIKLFEQFKLDENVNISSKYLDFIDLLKNNNVPIDEYGKGTYKTLGHLYNEIEEGETILSEEDGLLVRRVQFVGARIIYKKGDSWIRLYECKQIFKDGRLRKRDNMPYSAAEKFKSGEDPKEVIIRGMKEEIDIDITSDQFVFYNKVETENNDDYPGIKSLHTGYEFLVILNDDQYKPEGYIERQLDKDVYFEWREVSSLNESKSYNGLVKI